MVAEVKGGKTVTVSRGSWECVCECVCVCQVWFLCHWSTIRSSHYHRSERQKRMLTEKNKTVWYLYVCAQSICTYFQLSSLVVTVLLLPEKDTEFK